MTCQDKPVLSSRGKVNSEIVWQRNPDILGVSLNLPYSEVVRKLGYGKLIYTSPSYVKKQERRYEWKRAGGILEIGFNKDNKVIYIGYSGSHTKQAIGGIRL